MESIFKILVGCLNFLFAGMKLMPVKNKITYISRQMDSVPLDFQLTIEEFKKQDDSYTHVVLAKTIPKGIVGKLAYCFHILIQMYHIATSKIVILDTYCIAVSLLKQRKSLIVIQMWHALGAFKKFGYSILDQKEGSSSKVAKMMKMHENYTYVLASSKYVVPYFAEAFHVEEEKVKVFPLPKTDLLINEAIHKEIVDKIWKKYPNLSETRNKVVVYAPTFRKELQAKEQMQEAVDELIRVFDFEGCELVIKKHPLSEFEVNDERVIMDYMFSTLEFLHVADVVITDYSAVLFEALMMTKPIHFYAFDKESYMKNRDFYISYETEMPGKIAVEANELLKNIENGALEQQKIVEYRDKMIVPCKESYTKDFVAFLREELD